MAHLQAGAGGVQARLAGLQCLAQGLHALGAHLQAQPRGVHIAVHLAARGLDLGAGLVPAAQAFGLLGAAPAAGVQRHAELHAHHGVDAAVARTAVVATAAQALIARLRHQVHRGGGAAAVLVGLGLRDVGGQLLQADLGVAVLRLGLPVRQRGLGARGLGHQRCGQVRLQAVHGQAGAVGQLAAAQVQRHLGGEHLGAQCALARARLVRGGDGGGAQREAVLRLGGGLLHGLVLALQHLERFLRHGQLEVALRGAQHQRLLRGLPLQLGAVGLQAQLLLLGAALGVEQGLARLQRPARGRAAGDRGAEVHAVRRAHAGGRELRAAHVALARGHACGCGERHARAPQGARLVAQGLRRGLGRAGHGQFAVVLLRGLPGLQQVGGPGCGGGQCQGQQGGAPEGLHWEPFCPRAQAVAWALSWLNSSNAALALAAYMSEGPPPMYTAMPSASATCAREAPSSTSALAW